MNNSIKSNIINRKLFFLMNMNINFNIITKRSIVDIINIMCHINTNAHTDVNFNINYNTNTNINIKINTNIIIINYNHNYIHDHNHNHNNTCTYIITNTIIINK